MTTNHTSFGRPADEAPTVTEVGHTITTTADLGPLVGLRPEVPDLEEDSPVVEDASLDVGIIGNEVEDAPKAEDDHPS